MTNQEVGEMVQVFGREVVLDLPIDGASAVDWITRIVREIIARDNISPEITKAYLCQTCGNRTEFIGIDSDGFPGFRDDCECGYGKKRAEGTAERDEYCTCTAVLRQPFTVDPSTGEADYHLFTVLGDDSGEDAEIYGYDRIICGACFTTIWEEREEDPS